MKNKRDWLMAIAKGKQPQAHCSRIYDIRKGERILVEEKELEGEQDLDIYICRSKEDVQLSQTF